MPDELHITRAAPGQPPARPITPDEVYAAAAADPDLQVVTDAFDEGRGEDGQVRRVHPLVTSGDLASDAYLWPTGTGVVVRAPSDVTIRKMIDLARRLDATVTDGDGGVFALDADGRLTLDGVPYGDPDDPTGVPPQPEPLAQVVPDHPAPADDATHPYLAPAWHRLGWVVLAALVLLALAAWLL